MSMFETAASIPERDQRAEVITRLLDTAENIQAFEGKKFEEVFRDEQSKREFLERIKEEDFVSLIDGMNGILQGKDKAEWTADGEGVALTGFVGDVIVPRAEDKAALLSKVFEGMKTMNTEGRSLEDISILLSANINAIHLYKDANGRTSRLVYSLLTEEWSDETKEKVKELLGEYGRDLVDINPGFIGYRLTEVIRNEAGMNDSQANPENLTNLFSLTKGTRVFHDEVPKENREVFEDMVRKDSAYGFLAAFNFLKNRPDRGQFLKAYPGRAVILEDRLVAELSADEIAQLLEEYWLLKRRHVELLTDSIVDPDKPDYKVVEDGAEISILDMFKKKIRRYQESNKA